MGTNDTKMGWKCHGDGDSTALQPYIKPTATWLSPQCTKQRVLKFGLGTNKRPPPPSPTLRRPHLCGNGEGTQHGVQTNIY